jgi:ATP-dependent DNA helicase RecQ
LRLRLATFLISENRGRAARKAFFYHAGLKAKDRWLIHERFMSGDAELIVATNAFGMGVLRLDDNVPFWPR